MRPGQPPAAGVMSDVRIRPGATTDRDAVRALLAQCALPTRDLDDADVRFWVAEQEARIAGVIGLERHGQHGLLRSLAVAPEARGRGHGLALVATLEHEARQAGLRSLVLLTETARTFFERLGYTVIARSNAPAAVQASAEFRSLCPASATCMQRILANESAGA